MRSWVRITAVVALGFVILIGVSACRSAPTALPLPTSTVTRTPTRPATAVPTATSVATSIPTRTRMPLTPTARPVPTSAPAASPTPAATPSVSQVPNDNSFVSEISADGRYVAFVSWANNLVEGDTNERPDVFVYDRYTGAIARVSVASDGTQSDGVSGGPSMSAYGRWVAFGSEAKSLEPDPDGWEWDTFVHDVRTGQTERIDLIGEGARGRRPSTSSPGDLSADGRYLALAALTSEQGGPWHIYVHDRWTGQNERISVGTDGAPGDGWSIAPVISGDGRYVAFWSWAGNLVAEDERACEEAGTLLSCGDVFVYDRHAREMARIPVGEGYGLGGGGYELSISDDGRYVALRGSVYDRRTQTLAPYCGLDEDEQSEVRASAMSADGRWIAFTNGQVYLCDRQNGAITPVSMAPDGAPGDGPSGIVYGHEGYSGDLDLSADGRWLVLTSQAGNLVPGDAKDERCQRPLAVVPGVPHCYDVYLYDRETGAMARVGAPRDTRVTQAASAMSTRTPLPALAALAAYEPVTDDAGPVADALSSEIARWLAAQVPTTEAAAWLNEALPEKREPVTVAKVDLTGDGLEDVVVHIPLMGLPLLVLVRQEGPDATYEGHALPPDLEAIRLGWAHSLTEADHGIEQPALYVADLTGDGVSEVVITHGYAGASNLRLRPHAYQWHEGDFRLIFAAELTSWAGYSTLHLEPDPDGGQVIRLSYPVFLPGRTPKGDPNPQGEQSWRWDADAGRYRLAWQTIAPEPAGGPTVDLARAEEALVHGVYSDAIALYNAFLADEAWQEVLMEPYMMPGASQRVGERGLAGWLDLARLRRGIALALSGRSGEAKEALAQVRDTGALADLAGAFLDAYTPSVDPIAGLAAYERRRAEGPTCEPEKDLIRGPIDCPGAVTYHAYLPEPLLVLAALAELGTDGLAAALAERDAPVADLTVHDLDGDGAEEVLWIGAPPWRVYGIYNLPRSDWQQAWVAWQGEGGWRATGIAAADRIGSLTIAPPDAQGRRGIRLERIDPDEECHAATLFWDGTVKRPWAPEQPADWPDVGWPLQ